MAAFEVVGEDGGTYVYDDAYGMMGAAQPIAARPVAHPAPRAVFVPPRPAWRNGQMAPGVIHPDEGMIPLPLTPLTNGGVFATGIPQIIYQGQLQKPYRPERLLVSVVRTGTTATGRLLSQLFVGTDLQQGDIQGFDMELIGSPTAFGTRLTCKPAQPGVLIRLVVTPTTVPSGTDTILATAMFTGRVVH